MTENIYSNVDSIKELKKCADVNFFVNEDAIGCYSNNNERENDRTMENLEVQKVTGNNSTWKRCYTVSAVCVVLLGASLLTAIAVLWIKLNNLQTEKLYLQKQKDLLQNKLSSMGWVLFQSNFYYISTEKKSWTDSRKDCRVRGADLVIINNKEEQAFVKKLSESMNHGIYIGLNDRENESVWKWVDGTSMTTPYWSSTNRFSNISDCAVNRYEGVDGWFDRPCTEKYYWMCE